MPALVDRPKMTRIMYENLKRHIMRERAKIKQEQEQDAMIERMRKEREQRKKKEAEEALTLEQTKEQMEKKLEELRSQKHQLFLQLKKVLNQEDETRRRAQIKEQSEMQILQQQAAFSQHGLGPPVMMLQAQHMSNRPSLCKPVQIAQAPMKRARSPSPPASSSYQTSYHSDPKYAAYSGKPGPSHMYAQHASASDFSECSDSLSHRLAHGSVLIETGVVLVPVAVLPAGTDVNNLFFQPPFLPVEKRHARETTEIKRNARETAEIKRPQKMMSRANTLERNEGESIYVDSESEEDWEIKIEASSDEDDLDSPLNDRWN